MLNRIVYINGEYINEHDAKVSIFDRGFLFADAVYEVTAVINGKLVDNEGHMARLTRSCHELQLTLPVNVDEIEHIQNELIRLNQITEGGIYLQLTRGSAGDRDFGFPEDAQPTLVMFTQSRSLLDSPKAKEGLKVMTMEDIRWHRRDIKTTQLLASALAKQTAHDQGFDDAWLTENGYITEGSSNNAYIVTADNTVVTRPLSNDILHGITRAALMKLADEQQIKVEERLFTPEEAMSAKEAFISSATTFVYPVVKINDKVIGNGKPGPMAQRLRDIYIELAIKQTS
ncbi:D-amino-acid transaminase [Celerinatantimonas sp. MCCC 1A17872]|uniref:D-amino-acid transaminase n=1 Tax=Celerinatantimonas sp. MCCC 1A17872 TaxID=3177514 RepID=UPI0038C04EA7